MMFSGSPVASELLRSLSPGMANTSSVCSGRVMPWPAILCEASQTVLLQAGTSGMPGVSCHSVT